ncbi:probable beta-D-xylosidase 7 [Vicia villosa]|uniref:probable beta-D-xylosidase 7 n=1 Tax=Vicia villosa TaxID=3911 RepID=UPI00273BD5AF|nr:probable beta-D-xylosidase 7 [Vicia villosa]
MAPCLAEEEISPAMMARSSIILKPPTQGAVSTLHMIHCFHLVDFPKSLISYVTGKCSKIGYFLTMHPGVNCISFNGGGLSVYQKDFEKHFLEISATFYFRASHKFIESCDCGDYLRTVCDFTAYDLDNQKGVNRFHFDTKVILQNLADTYQPPFRIYVEQRRARGIMCAANRVNGVPSCVDYNLLTKILRKQWGFQGYIASDCGAVVIIHDQQGYTKSAEEVVADVMQAGMDLECVTYLTDHAKSTVQHNQLPIYQIDSATHNLFSIRIRLILFGGNPTKLPFGMNGPNHLCSKNHLYLALEATRNNIILLKKIVSLLPLLKTSSIFLAVIGPNANDAPLTLLRNYVGPPCKSITILQGFWHYVKEVVFHPGCDGGPKCPSTQIDQAVEVAKFKQWDPGTLMLGTISLFLY